MSRIGIGAGMAMVWFPVTLAAPASAQESPPSSFARHIAQMTPPGKLQVGDITAARRH